VRAGRVLGNFELCPINFEPTFKRVKGEVYGFNEKRVPSYTDRICYHSLEGFRGNVRNTYFNTNTEISFSDHKPVFGHFEIDSSKADFSHLYIVKDEDEQQEGTVEEEQPEEGEEEGEGREPSYFELVVSNLSATDLPEMDPAALGGKSDPYIRFFCDPPKRMMRIQEGKTKRTFMQRLRRQSTDDINVNHIRTEVQGRTLNPVWTDVIRIRMNMSTYEELSSCHLILALYDYDMGSADDLMGTVVLSLKESVFRKQERNESTWNFTRMVMNNGLEYGELQGNLELIFHEN
jgi:hypothetical protein